MPDRPTGSDSAGFEVLTTAILSLLNQYPGLNGKQILFQELGETSGISFSASEGALILSERKSITGRITQQCQYPFCVVYRLADKSEMQQLQTQSFLDSLGKWLSKEPILIDGILYQLNDYPKLSDPRKITQVTRSNSYGKTPNANGTQDWFLPVTVLYTNEQNL